GLAMNGGAHGHGGQAAAQQGRGFQRQQAQMAQGQQLHGNGMKAQRQAFAGQQFNGAITGQTFGGAMRTSKAAQVASQQFIQQSANRYAVLSYGNNGQVLPVTEVTQFVGQPVSAVPAFVGLSPLPVSLQYLYPATSA